MSDVESSGFEAMEPGRARVVRARFEKGVLKPLEPLDLREGEEVRILVLPEEFPRLASRISVEAHSDVGDALRKGRERWARWY